MAKHADKSEKRKETFEASRTKVTQEVVDNWLVEYRAFLSERNVLDNPHKIYNEGETGFTMGSKA